MLFRCTWMGLYAVLLLPGISMNTSAGEKEADEKKPVPKKAEAKPETKKEAPKEAPPPRLNPGFPDIDRIIENLPATLPQVQVDRIRTDLEQAKKRMEEAQKRFDDFKARPVPGFPGRVGSIRGENRLGVRLEKPGAALIAQLSLPEGKGLVIEKVRDESAAAKAGLKTSDILLELDGKAVSSDLGEFVKALNTIKAGTPVDAVVLRKGMKTSIKGITLPTTPVAPAVRIEIK